MTKKQLRYSVKCIRESISGLECDDINHSKKDKHHLDEICPVLYRLYSQVNMIERALKDNDLI